MLSQALVPQQVIHHPAIAKPNRLTTLPAFRLIASFDRLEWHDVMTVQGGVDLDFENSVSIPADSIQSLLKSLFAFI